MNFRWLWLNHFPRGLDLTDQQRTEAKRRAREHRRREQNYRGSFRAAMLSAALMTGVLIVVFFMWLYALIRMRLGPGGHVLANVSGILMFQALIWISISWALHRSSVPYVRKALNDMGMPVCVECGYILRGIHQRTACPECGTHRDSIPAPPGLPP